MDLSLYGFKTLFQAYNIHPLFVHFPVALLPTTLFLYGLGVVLKKPSLLTAGRVCLYLALCGVVAAVITGLLGAPDIPHDEAIEHIMETHKHTAYIILGLTAILVAWSFFQSNQRPKAAWGFVGLLTIAAYFAVQNGDLGSRMVFIHGAAVKPAASYVRAQSESDQSSRKGGSPEQTESSSGKSSKPGKD